MEVIENAISPENGLEKKCGNAIGRFFNTAHAFGYLPYKYNRVEKKLEFVPQKRYIWLFKINFAMVLAYEMFLIGRYTQEMRNGASTMRQKITGMFFPFAYAAMALNHVISWTHWGSLHLFFNTSKGVTDEVKGDARGRKEHEKMLKLERNSLQNQRLISNIGTAIIATTLILRAGKGMVKPESPELLSSILMDLRPGCKINFWSRIAFTVLQLHVTACQIVAVVFHGLNCTIHGINMTAALAALKVQDETLCMEDVHRLKRSYCRLGVLQSIFNQLYSLWPLIFELLSVCTVTVRLFLAVIFHSSGNLISGLALLFGLIIGFRFFAEVYEASVSSLSSWASIPETWFRKCRKGMRPIKISVGNFFFVDYSLILTIMCIVISNTTNLIMTYNRGH